MFGVTDFGKAIVDFSNFDISQLGNAAIFGGAILLIGMLAVFAVLVVIWLCLVLFKVAFHDLPSKKSEDAPEVSATLVPMQEAAQSTDDEIVAVIAAAIAMAESESSGIKFRVVSFKRK